MVGPGLPIGFTRTSINLSMFVFAGTLFCGAACPGAADESHTVPKVAPLSWQSSGQTTFAGAMECAMAGFPQHPDYATIMGSLGLAFRTRWHTPPTGKPYFGVAPLGELGDDSETIAHVFGLNIRSIEAPAAKPEVREQVLKDLIAAISKDRPVVCYVNPHQDGAVAYGYLDGGKTIQVRDYYQETGNTQPFSKLGEHFWFLEPGDAKPLTPKEALLGGLKWAIKNSTRKDQPEFGGGHFCYGAQAFAAWREALAAAGEGIKGPHLTPTVNWWVMNGLADARSAAAVYLRKSAALLGDDAKPHLSHAVELYAEEAKFTRDAINSNTLFFPPFSGKSEGEWTPDVRKRESEMLTRCEKVEAEAIGELEKALAALK